jgi:stress-induced-phosphoprotein 1
VFTIRLLIFLSLSFLQSDPRMIDVLGVMLGIDMQGYTRPEGSTDFEPDLPQHGEAKPSPTSPQPGPSTPPTSASHPPTPQKEKDVEMEADDEDARNKREAEAAKAAGSAAYKKRDFAEALTQYTKAWELWPKDMTYLTNAGGS